MNKSWSDQLEQVVARWKGKDGSLIMILHEVQNRLGYVPREMSLEIARLLDIPLARIYEVLTFYHYFKLKAPGKHRISVCMGTACYLRGAPDVLEELKDVLNVKEGGTTSDGLFQLDVVRCLGCCGLAPVMMIDDKVFGKVAKSQVTEILSQFGREKDEEAALS
jgi:NADH-quinone oxidoreductase subunit E